MPILKRLNQSQETPFSLKKLHFPSQPQLKADSKSQGKNRIKKSLFVFRFKRFALNKIIPLIASLGILSLVLSQTEPPKTLSSASVFQVFLFFIPLTAFVYFILNLTPINQKNKLLLTVGLLVVLLLKGMERLNPITFIIFIMILGIIFKLTYRGKKFDYQAKIPKLSHLSKQH